MGHPAPSVTKYPVGCADQVGVLNVNDRMFQQCDGGIGVWNSRRRSIGTRRNLQCTSSDYRGFCPIAVNCPNSKSGTGSHHLFRFADVSGVRRGL
jgi:hypothetical protein